MHHLDSTGVAGLGDKSELDGLDPSPQSKSIYPNKVTEFKLGSEPKLAIKGSDLRKLFASRNGQAHHVRKLLSMVSLSAQRR